MPEPVAFATKPRLAEAMVGRALWLGVRAAWATGDAVYGNDGAFRRFLERAAQPHVLAVQVGQRLWVGFEQRRVDARATEFAPGAWHRAAPGAGRRGRGCTTGRWRRTARWTSGGGGCGCWYGGTGTGPTSGPVPRAGRCRGPADTPWQELVRAAGARWAVEECFERAKGTCGLDQYEVRSWAGWHRHITLSLWALSVVAVIRSRATRPAGKRKGARS